MVFFPSHEIRRHGGCQTDRGTADPEKGWVLAHLSDPHIACTEHITWHDLRSKRILGYLRWKLYRKTEHRQSVLTRLRSDLARTTPDHIVVTGDLTQLSLPVEFDKARRWLVGLGAPDRVTVVPGNHDTYVRTDWHQTFACWVDYMVSDPPYRQTGPVGGLTDLFPTLRIRGRIALIGVSSAHPSAPHLAVGGIGVPQLERLAALLKQTADRGLFRIVSIHHPPIAGIVSRRKHLTDRSALLRVISRFGTELILHGHGHRAHYNELVTQHGIAGVIAVPSASALGLRGADVARYNCYNVNRSDSGWQLEIIPRCYQPDTGEFVRGDVKTVELVRPA